MEINVNIFYKTLDNVNFIMYNIDKERDKEVVNMKVKRPFYNHIKEYIRSLPPNRQFPIR